MNTTEAKTMQGPISTTTAREVAGGSAAEAIGAIAVIALSIIGLVGLLSAELAAIATIILGASFLVEGWVLGSTHRMAVTQSGFFSQSAQAGGVSAQGLGGLAGIVLGILGLFQHGSEVLLGAAVLVFGATLLLRSWASFYPTLWLATPSQITSSATSMQFSASGWSGLVLVGVGAMVLGILAIVGLAPLTLVLVGLLSLGAAFLFGGTMGYSSSQT